MSCNISDSFARVENEQKLHFYQKNKKKNLLKIIGVAQYIWLSEALLLSYFSVKLGIVTE